MCSDIIAFVDEIVHAASMQHDIVEATSMQDYIVQAASIPHADPCTSEQEGCA